MQIANIKIQNEAMLLQICTLHFALYNLLMNIDFKLYLITDRKKTTLPLPKAIRLALNGGVRAIQLREKDLPVRQLLALSQEIGTITKEFGAGLFINDRVDVAVAVDADGVHLGHQSMPVDAVRRIVGAKMLIGVSTHNLGEAKQAEDNGADFVTFGPVYRTLSKMQYSAPVGIEALKTVKKQVRIPVFGLGGIRRDTISQVLQAGADGIAMISAIFGADDIQKASRDILDALQ
jgi:thiamine-phosphate pyrophosphorylase